jgi:hypothetical protein
MVKDPVWLGKKPAQRLALIPFPQTKYRNYHGK